jgi:hypothetical protein
MHSGINYELAKARAPELCRRAERDTLARAARRARTRQGPPSSLITRPAAWRRILTLLAAQPALANAARTPPPRTGHPAGRQ